MEEHEERGGAEADRLARGRGEAVPAAPPSSWIALPVGRAERGPTIHELVDAVSRAVAEASSVHGVTTSVEVIDDRPAVEIDEGDPLVAALWDAHAAVASTAPRLGGVPGATDGTVLTSRGGITSVVYGPGGKWIAHQADEFVEVADLLTHADVYVDAATRFLAAPAA